MHCQMRPQDTLPILYGAPGSHGLLPIARLLAAGVHRGPLQTAPDEEGPNEGASSRTRTLSARWATPVLAPPPKGPARFPVPAFDLCCPLPLPVEARPLPASCAVPALHSMWLEPRSGLVVE